MSEQYDQLPIPPQYSECHTLNNMNIPSEPCVISEWYKTWWMYYYYPYYSGLKNSQLSMQQLYEQHDIYCPMCRYFPPLNRCFNCGQTQDSPEKKSEQTNQEPVKVDEENHQIQAREPINGDDVENNDWLEFSFKVLCGCFLTLLILVNITIPRFLFVLFVVLIVFGLKNRQRKTTKQEGSNLPETDQDDNEIAPTPTLLESFLCFISTFFSSLIPESLPAT